MIPPPKQKELLMKQSAVVRLMLSSQHKVRYPETESSSKKIKINGKSLFKFNELSLVVHGTSIRTYLGFTIAHKYFCG